MSTRTLGQIVVAAVAIVVVAWSAGISAPAKNRALRQATLLADLSNQIVACAVHPCLGDDAKDVRIQLSENIVTDDIFYFSDLNLAYPRTDGVLQGLVEWDFDSGPTTFIGFKIVNFDAAPTVLIHELEEALPGCEMEEDEDQMWSCFAVVGESEDVLIEVFFGPRLVLLEIGS